MRLDRKFLIGKLCGFVLMCGGGRVVEAQGKLPKLPVKEITVFKDGHAFVLHEGTVPTDANGTVVLDYLPTPVLGTFWPYSAEPNAPLTSVTAGTRSVAKEHTALSLRELLQANPGSEVELKLTDGQSLHGKLLGLPRRGTDEFPSPQEAISPILLQTENGVIILPFDQIRNATLKGKYSSSLGNEELRNLMTLKLAWLGGNPGKTAHVGMVYLQKGVRWIPNYKIVLDGKGSAMVKLQATVLNELTNLEDVTVNLVIGVPSFFFQDTPDPIALQQGFAELSPYFQTGTLTGGGFSNGIMTQGRAGERFLGGQMGGGRVGSPGAAPNLGPDLGQEAAQSGKSEDLFIFTVKHLSLKKGERMVLPVTEFPLKYKDTYVLDIPFTPPQEIRGSLGGDAQVEMARLLSLPKVLHKIRLTNSSHYPLTTAPALLMLGDRVLSQSLMTYTAIGASVDVTLTTATDINVRKSDKETGRTPNAVNFQNHAYGRIDLAGTLNITNYGKTAVEVEVARNVLGNIGKATNGGVAEMLNTFEDGSYLALSDAPNWWRSYSWPYWWYHFNGVGRITWKVKLEPGKSSELGYTWHYFWE